MELYDLFRKYPRVTTDSRRIVAGGIFFALHGETFDGNRYAGQAIAAGAAVAVVDDPTVAGKVPEAERERYFVVPDTLKALQELAARHRRQLGIPILAITGSNGKTTTKELISRTLGRKYRVAVTAGNFNNHIGVPLTLLAMDRSAEFGIVEMGASHCGEIALLCSIAQPDFGLITNIGKAHLEGFGGIEGVMRGKGELLDYLQAHGGTAFYFSESEYLARMVGERAGLQAVPYSTAGLTAAEEENYLTVCKGRTLIRTHLVGDYNIGNVAAAIAVGGHFGVSEQQIAAAVGSYEPDNNRSQRKAGAHNTLIMDAYNANPSSMRAALENFAKETSEQPKAVVLGDMGELGKYAETEHAGIVELLQQLGIGEGYLVGKHFSEAGRGKYPVFADADSLNEYLKAHPVRDRLVFIKGSRTMKLENVAENL